MKRLIFLCLTSIILSNFGYSQHLEKGIAIIPKPVEVHYETGFFIAANNTFKFTGNNIPDEFKSFVSTALPIKFDSKKGSLLFIIDKKIINKEKYKLKVTKNEISIVANSEIGWINGFQSFRQLWLSCNDGEIRIPCLTIVDQPAYAWRGTMLDVSRHFFKLDFLKKYIDVLSFYKINKFHLHLTDDNGWRIEIKKYPRLTSIGAWRPKRNENDWKKIKETQPYEKHDYGGFYTQNEIKELIKYAQVRNVEIIPEIDIPGHALAAIASYPSLSCFQENYQVATGYPSEGKNVICAGKKENILFFKNVLKEISNLFPSKYIHIGGDEVSHNHWDRCINCKERKNSLGIEDNKNYQHWFLNEVTKEIRKKKFIIGWDEIIESKKNNDEIIMSWRGEEKINQSFQNGNEVIMAANRFLYFDTYQEKCNEPKALGGFVPLKKVYETTDLISKLELKNKKKFKGIEACIWTEYLKTPAQVEYMSLPRIVALAEVSWSKPELTEYSGFLNRLSYHFNWFDTMNLTYHIPRPDFNPKNAIIRLSKDSGAQFEIMAPGEIIVKNVGGETSSFSSPLVTSIEADSILTVATKLKSGKRSDWKQLFFNEGRKIKSIKIVSEEKDENKEVKKIINGIRGSDYLRDGEWVQFEQDSILIELELLDKHFVKQITIGFLKDEHYNVDIPKSITVEILNLKKNKDLKLAQNRIEGMSKNAGKKNCTIQINSNVKKLRLKIKARFNPNTDTKINKINIDEIIIL